VSKGAAEAGWGRRVGWEILAASGTRRMLERLMSVAMGHCAATGAFVAARQRESEPAFLVEASANWPGAPGSLERLVSALTPSDVCRGRVGGDDGIVLVPLTRRFAVVGVLGLAGPVPESLVDARELCALISPAVHESLRRDRGRRELANLATLYEVGKVLSGLLDLDAALAGIVAMACDVIDAEAGSLLLVDREQNDLVFRIAHGGGGEGVKAFRVPMGQGIAGHVAATGKGLIIKDAQRDARLMRTVGDATGFVTRSMICVPMIRRGSVLGVIQVINKRGQARFADSDFRVLSTLAGQAAIVIENANLYLHIKQVYLSTIQVLAEALDAKDAYTRGHSDRVARYSVAMAEELGLSSEEKERVSFAALLHDIGKIGVADSVLNKVGDLTPEERRSIQSHPQMGAEILHPVGFLSDVSTLIRHHHAWYDGSGYVGGAREEELPLGARIIAVADAYDAMSSDRPYRKALPWKDCRERLLAGAGTQWEEICVRALVRVVEARAWERVEVIRTLGGPEA
jgi:putative nucleotidyltransferase with HDIG domain